MQKMKNDDRFDDEDGIMIPVKKTVNGHLRKKHVIPKVEKKKRKNILPVIEELFRSFMYIKIL